MEDYTFCEQIDIFTNSKLIVAPHGAGLVYSIFCNKDSHVIEIIPPNNEPNLDCFINIYNSINISYSKFTDMISFDKNYNMIVDIPKLVDLINTKIYLNKP
jgi:capsular polysaccharide biosynthesis protein